MFFYLFFSSCQSICQYFNWS